MIAAARKRAVLVVLGILLSMGSACGLFGRAKPSEAPEAARPAAPAPTAPLRERGAQIADEAMLQQLAQGRTTKAEVREKFGVPQEIVLSPGTETYLYFRERSKGWISRACERVEMLTVRFDPQGLLKDFEYRFAGQ